MISFVLQFVPLLRCVRLVMLALFLAFIPAAAYPQTVALLNPEKAAHSETISKTLGTSLEKNNIRVLDFSLGAAVFFSKDFKNPFNLTTSEARNLGNGIGCNFFVLVRSGLQRRSSFERKEYYESFVALYVVNSQTGRLRSWIFKKFEKETPQLSKTFLDKYIEETAVKLVLESIRRSVEGVRNTAATRAVVSDENDPGKTGKPPLPYRRLKPKYTDLAALYDIEATVDIEVEINEKGEVSKTDIVRWAGYGLDESVIKTVKEMQWRPGETNGKAFPMRILLRYNFKNIETEE
ncbi:MAG: TonB family protein [Pyrinomonadaceae bacterium]|nr:TonB family protein [Pyrinomonadaceae bacterium]